MGYKEHYELIPAKGHYWKCRDCGKIMNQKEYVISKLDTTYVLPPRYCLHCGMELIIGEIHDRERDLDEWKRNKRGKIIQYYLDEVVYNVSKYARKYIEEIRKVKEDKKNKITSYMDLVMNHLVIEEQINKDHQLQLFEERLDHNLRG